MGLVMTIDTGHTHRNKAELRQLLSDRDAEIARQSAELQARDLLIEKLKLQRNRPLCTALQGRSDGAISAHLALNGHSTNGITITTAAMKH